MMLNKSKNKILSIFIFTLALLLTQGCSDSESSARELYNKGMKYQKNGQIRGAITVYNSIIFKYPDTVTAIEVKELLVGLNLLARAEKKKKLQKIEKNRKIKQEKEKEKEQKSIPLATLAEELSTLTGWDHDNQKDLRKFLKQVGIFDNFSEIRYNCHSMEKTERELSYIARNEFETTEEYKQRQYKTNYSAFERYFSRDVLMNVKYINKYNADQKRFESDIRTTNFDDKADFLQESKSVYNNSKYGQSDCYFRFTNLDQLMLDLPMERELAKISKGKIRIMILFSFNEDQGAIDLDYSRTEGYVKTQNYFIKVQAKAVIFYMDNKLLKSLTL
ncbi:MAG: hypothetical protein ACI93P_002374 [bacterium]|jgi:hypothetical protein